MTITLVTNSVVLVAGQGSHQIRICVRLYAFQIVFRHSATVSCKNSLDFAFGVFVNMDQWTSAGPLVSLDS